MSCVRSRILYIAHTGLLQPLGRLQRPEDLADRARLAGIKAQCAAGGFLRERRRHHKRPSIPATLHDILVEMQKELIGALSALLVSPDPRHRIGSGVLAR